MYKIFTVASGAVFDGAVVEKFALSGAGVTIPAVLVGEKGRGRRLGVLPVQLLPDQREIWEEKGSVTIHAAEVGQTRAGKPKLIARLEADTDEKVLVVFRTKIGFRGGNSHTGDRTAEWWELDESYFIEEGVKKAGIPLQEKYTADKVREYSPRLMEAAYPGESGWRWDAGFVYYSNFAPFPGEVLVEGTIAQGDAGRMGAGSQLVALVPKGAVFRTSYSGRLYGAPAAHYYVWTGEKLLSATRDERELADLF